ncbi:MAG: hypothetical protein BWY31_01049 [Lentisphaerae bacterium ADurb.Bin242]|nr:MAG: hypothetical protein BWY31_01049 [Lentisphaerae bacterium ADurb.Bin242]
MKTILRKRYGERGQVLILSVVAVVILAAAILVFFDVQRVMRGKIKVISGIDAAALTGAAWQKNFLNLIGELNLVKACDVLVSNSLYGIGRTNDNFMKITPSSDPAILAASVAAARQELAQLKTAADMLTEMQVRVAFVGPLIGFGAAQQAAKNNGIPHNDDCNRFMIDLYNNINDMDIYGNEDLAPQNYYGYEWRLPYAAMIQEIVGSLDPNSATGVAVGTSVEYLGMPRLYTDPPTTPNFVAYLQLRAIFDAIAANDWCVLQALLEADYSGKWWGNIKVDINRNFLGGSEILPLHTTYTTGQQIYDFADQAGYLDDATQRKSGRADQVVKLGDLYNRLDPVTPGGSVNWADTDLKFNPLPSITWATFGDRWGSYENFNISKDDWSIYLRNSFREGADYYSGALSHFSVRVPNKTLSSRYNLFSGFQGIGPSSARKTTYASSSSSGNKASQVLNTYADRAVSGQARMTTEYICFNATAKPFGSLKATDGKVHFSFAARIVLPVFDKVALIPVALERTYGNSMDDRAWIIYLTKYLPALGTVDNLDDVRNMMEPEHYKLVEEAGYIALIKKLTNAAWRAEGVNWLNSEATGYDQYDSSGNYIGHVIQSLNRDHCLDWPSGGGGGGPRPGPPILN